MSKELGIIVIHGMGETKGDYYFGLQENIGKILGKKIWEKVAKKYCFCECQYKIIKEVY